MFIVAREPGLGENGQGFMTVSLKDGVISLDICLAVQISLDVRLQILRTDDLAKVEATQKALDEIGFPPRDQKLITVEGDGVLPLYKLRIGPLRDRYTAKLVIHKIQPLGISDPLSLAEPCGQKPAASVRR